MPSAEVLGVSTDSSPSQKEFATKLSLSFPLLSDFKDCRVGEVYGILMVGIANRDTFVIGQDGKIEFMESGGDAHEDHGCRCVCSRLAHK